jgi:hypothetical protein
MIRPAADFILLVLRSKLENRDLHDGGRTAPEPQRLEAAKENVHAIGRKCVAGNVKPTFYDSERYE